MRRPIRATLKHLETTIENLDQTIERTVERQADLAAQCRALETIKGIGKVTAVTLTAELGDLTRYGRNQLVAAAGLYPKQFTSGKTVWRRPRLAKGGGARVRRVLYMCATSLLHSNGPLRELAEQHRQRNQQDMVVIGILMRKLLLIARSVMKNNGIYDPSKILRQPQPARA